ncbi:CLUMA_CG021111, isoform A [Clunio marinus]|uniref:CLUMA_CG021111, isoform A n=1 Tax=Clunio marinus TaxID=568069 RepID=A0A1J1J679_9DIPT|nr:CLUMA_CG021111, isoform A [Clunio marinus]
MKIGCTNREKSLCDHLTQYKLYTSIHLEVTPQIALRKDNFRLLEIFFSTKHHNNKREGRLQFLW